VLTLSQRERDRLVVVRQVAAKELTVAAGAGRVGLGIRQMRRLVRRFEQEGDTAVVHGLRGRPSNRRLSEALRDKVLERSQDPLYRDFKPTLLSEHLERDAEIGFVHPSTLRLWMIGAGLWQPKKRRHRHRKRRERRAAFGELVFMDTSVHAWLEDRSREEIVLIALIDDATSRLYCRFFPRDTGAANRQLLIDYMRRHGRMGAVYADAAGHFQANFRRKEREENDQAEALTLIRRSLEALNVELIIALSPQAKGRVERLFGTLQDRLIKEMRVTGVTSLEEANRFLESTFMPFWNERFTVDPREPVDAHRPLPLRADLLRLFAETEERVIRLDFTFRYRNRFYQIAAEESDGVMPKTRVTIEQRLDGTTHIRWREKYLKPVLLAAAPTKPEPAKADSNPVQKPRPLTGAAGKPIPPDHPWRRFPVRVGKARNPVRRKAG
jgi:hypothetical protein